MDLNKHIRIFKCELPKFLALRKNLLKKYKSNKRKLSLCLVMLFIIILSGECLYSQIVTTFVTRSGLNRPDGFTLDRSGNLYVANWGGGTGSTILKIDSLALVSVYDSTMNAPDGLIFDAFQNLYISNYGSGIINKISSNGIKTVFASGLTNPSALAFDNSWNLYVSNFGGNTVSKITPEGNVSTFASGFNGPLGLVFDLKGNLYVSNYHSGIINKVDQTGVVTQFASVPDPTTSMIQYIVISPSGNLYLPSYGHNKIYKISPDGVVSVFAGTGIVGGNDGPVATAQFNGPNSIALTKDGNLYVSEYNANRIRKITGVEPTTSIKGNHKEVPKEFLLDQNYPNPFNPSTKLKYSVPQKSNVIIKVYNLVGEEVVTLLNEEKDRVGMKQILINQVLLPEYIFIE